MPSVTVNVLTADDLFPENNATALSEDDLAPRGPNDPKKNIPAFVHDYTPAENLMIGSGKRLTDIGRGIKDAWLRLSDVIPGIDNTEAIDKLKQLSAQEQKMYDEGIGNVQNKKRGWTTGGELLTDVTTGAILPGSRAKLLGRLKNAALTSGVFEGLTSQGTATERAKQAAVGTLGAAVGGEALRAGGKGVAGLFGKWDDPALHQLDTTMRKFGLKPQIGDIAPSPSAPFVRSAEDIYSRIPPGRERLINEGKKIHDIIVPDNSGKNLVTEAIDVAEENVNKQSNKIWHGFNKAIEGNVTSVRPIKLKEALDILADPKTGEYPQLLSQSAIPNKQVRDKLLDLLSQDPKKLKSIPIGEFNELRKSITSALNDVKRLATSAAAGSDAALDKRALYLTGNLLEGSKEDMARWGKNGSNQKAYNEFLKADKEWTNEILPWRNNQLTYDFSKNKTFGGPETAKTVSEAGVKDPALFDQLQEYLAKYGISNAKNTRNFAMTGTRPTSPDSTELLDIIRNSARPVRAASTLGGDVQHEGTIFTNVIAPMLTAPIHTVGAASNKPFAKGLYFGNSDWIMPERLEGLGSLKGALGGIGKQLATSAPISASREHGEIPFGALAMIYQMMGDATGKLIGEPEIGVESSTRGQGGTK